MHVAYFSGLFDGEGCVSIRQSPRYKLSVSLGNKNYEVLELLQEHYGGGIYHHSTVKGSTCWAWRVNGVFSLEFLESILPYSIIKRDQIKLGIRFIKEDTSQRDEIYRFLCESRR